MCFTWFSSVPGSQHRVKLDKNLLVCRVWCKSMKMLFRQDFDLIWLSVNSRLTRGILVNLIGKGTSSVSMPKRVTQCQSKRFLGPMEKRLYFWNFQGPACKSRVDKIQYLQLPILCLTSRLQGEVLDKERNSAFCYPKIAYENCAVHGLRQALPNKVELLQLVQKSFFWLGTLVSGRNFTFFSFSLFFYEYVSSKATRKAC